MTSLPSLRALNLAQGAQIWLATEATDMRCGCDRFAERLARRKESAYAREYDPAWSSIIGPPLPTSPQVLLQPGFQRLLRGTPSRPRPSTLLASPYETRARGRPLDGRLRRSAGHRGPGPKRR